MPFARDDSGGVAQTDTSLVAAPGADRQIVVYSLYIDCDATADTVLVESGNSTQRWEANMAANSQAFFQDDRGLFRCAANEALTYSTTTTSNIFISVRYEEARSTGE